MSFFKLFVNHNSSGSFVNSMRKKRFSRIQEMIEKLIAQKGDIKILDIGGDMGYWKNINFKNEHCTIYLLNLESWDQSEALPEGFYGVTGDALCLPYQPGDFDLVLSNSVIEHVGSKKNQQQFAEEVKKACDHYIIQTPSLWFPLEPHSLWPFFQFIPHSIRAFLIMWFHINYFPKAKTYQEALVVSRGTIMFTKTRFRKLFPEATIEVERLFGIPKSYTVIKG